jgi:hypothetical protein
MLKTVSIILLGYAAFSLWTAVAYHTALPLGGGLLALIAAVGVWRRRGWGRYFVFAVSSLLVVSWLWLTLSVAFRGWPYATISQSVIALLPGLLLVALAVAVSVAAHRGLRHAS